MKDPDKWKEDIWKVRGLLDRAGAYSERASSILGKLASGAPDKETQKRIRGVISKLSNAAYWIVGANVELGVLDVYDKEETDDD